MHFASLAFCILLAGFIPAHAMPHIPSDGNAVIETLPNRRDPHQQELARLRAALVKMPNDLALATQLARRYISASRVDGDPRYLGYAQAALHPWWNLESPPASVLLLRATILQSIHQFPQALVDLNAVLKADPNNGQAWLTRATILTVTGDYVQARESCGHLAQRAPAIVAQTCLANIGSLTGKALASYQALQQALARQPRSDEVIQVWVETLLGEMAVRLGRHAEAEAHFKSAMAQESMPDGYLLGAYSDFLLENNRYAEVVNLLKEKTRNDALLLRYALALKRTGSPLAAAQTELLRARFAAAAMRGDTVHLREQSRFELHLMGDARKALATAQKNWAVQKEPADLRALAEAAAATGDQAAGAVVQAWIAQTGFEDGSLMPLLAHLGAAK